MPTLPYYFWFIFIDRVSVTSVIPFEVAVFCTDTVDVDLIV